MVASRTPASCLLVLLVAGSVGCGVLYVDENTYNEKLAQVSDEDGDGHKGVNWRGGFDCDDGNIHIHPDAEEVCDGVDNNCDGETDEDSATDASTWYGDIDGDGFGDAAYTKVACEAPSGFVADNTDCDDMDPGSTHLQTDGDCDGTVSAEDCDDGEAAVHPGAEEVCDGIDNNCDGTVDEATATDAATWFADADDDGFGDALTTVVACAAPTGFVADNTDCDDTVASTWPGAEEVCDNADNNCDGETDESSATDAPTWYADGDGDGYGDAATAAVSCRTPLGFVADNTDCDDAVAATHPSADEICDGVDNDCDSTVDNGNDVDADGYDDLCDGDCNDADAAIHPGAQEVCDPADTDEDCDGLADNDDNSASGAFTFYIDTDQDGYGDTTTGVACDLRLGLSSTSDDCDDSNANIYPGADETCDGVDNDCDGDTDEDDAVDATPHYPDWDGDGYGLDSGVVTNCGSANSAPTTDSGTSSPGAAINESTTVTDDITLVGCGSIDEVTVDVDISHAYRNDLDIRLTGPSGTTIGLWQYRGSSQSDLLATFTDSGSSSNDYGSSPLGDIGPSDPLSTFDGETSAGTWTLTVEDFYSGYDGTLNSWGVNVSCDVSTLVANGGDCDETDASIHPGATEIFGDGVDNDCDGSTDNLDLVQVDTATRLPSTVYGPRVSARSEGIYLAWATDSYQENSATVYDGAIVSTYDPADLAGGPTSEITLGESSDQGTLGTDFDFAVDDTYFYLATSQVRSGTNALIVDTILKSSGSLLPGTSSGQIGGSQTYEDVKLFLMEDTSSGDFVSAVGCGVDGIDAVLGEATNIAYGSAYTAKKTGQSPSTCTSLLYYNSSMPFFEAYYYARDYGNTQGKHYSFNPSNSSFSSGAQCNWDQDCEEAVDMRHWRNNGYRASAYAVNQPGINLTVTRASEDDEYSWYTKEDYQVPETLQVVDVDVTTSGIVYVCGVGASGSAWIHVVDVNSSAAPTTIQLTPTSGAYEDCSISISENDVMSVAVRSGTDIYLGAVQLP